MIPLVRKSDPRPVTPVGIVAAKLERVADWLGTVAGVDAAILSELREARQLVAGLDGYLSECTTPESPALRELAQRTAGEDWSRHPGREMLRLEQEMLSGHLEGQLLKMLVRLSGARRVLEIGMFTGYSALAMAEALPAGGTVTACEIDPDVASFAQQCFDESASGNKIDIRVGPALITLHELAEAGERFDLVFVDADKAGYIGYVETILSTSLLAPRGVILVDNTLMQGQPYLPTASEPAGLAIESFNRTLAADPRVEQVLVPLRDGITIIRRVDQPLPDGGNDA